jgi:RHS repeat-associated protein
MQDAKIENPCDTVVHQYRNPFAEDCPSPFLSGLFSKIKITRVIQEQWQDQNENSKQRKILLASIQKEIGSIKFGFGEAYSSTQVRGGKSYELSDHLGNVAVVVGDCRLAVDGNADLAVDFFEAEILSARDFYPFGMVMPERSFSTSTYRYGFNGKEFDSEWKGEGNSYDYGFRVHDARLGRFLSVDPLAPEYPWYTPYQFAGNSPIRFLDLDGLEILDMGNANGKGNIIILLNGHINSFNHDKMKNENWDFAQIRTLESSNDFVEKYKKRHQIDGINTVIIFSHGLDDLGDTGIWIGDLHDVPEGDHYWNLNRLVSYRDVMNCRGKSENPDDPRSGQVIDQLMKLVENIEDGGSLIFEACYGGRHGDSQLSFAYQLSHLIIEDHDKNIEIYFNIDLSERGGAGKNEAFHIRWNSGITALEDFDHGWIKYSMGPDGKAVFESLKTNITINEKGQPFQECVPPKNRKGVEKWIYGSD